MSKANGTKDGSTVLLSTNKSTALLQLLWARVVSCVDCSFRFQCQTFQLQMLLCSLRPLRAVKIFRGAGWVVSRRSVGVSEHPCLVINATDDF